MKRRNVLLIILALLTITLYNSCKKDGNSVINDLIARGSWELASLQVYNYVGDTRQSVDTLNTDCTRQQVFTFNADGTCTYQNYYCIDQRATGNWTLSRDKLYLTSDIVCKDTLANGDPGVARPFENAKIINLGQYSLVINVGDIQSNYPPTQRRRIVQYSFIRQKNTATGGN